MTDLKNLKQIRELAFFPCILILKWNLALIYYLYCLCFSKDVVSHSVTKYNKKTL